MRLEPAYRLLRGLALVGLVVSVAACGGDDGDGMNDPAPMLIAGGGIGSGPIKGRLNVYVTDSRSRAPLAGASVRVGAAPLMGTTDATGLAVFTDASLLGPTTVTAFAPSYAVVTEIGINGANVTLGLEPRGLAAIPTARVSGTIAGWTSLPAPAAQHQTLAVIGYSQTQKLGDRENEIAQVMRSVGPAPGFSIPANLCVRNALVNDCNFELVTRVGKQAHYAVLIDEDTKGTQNQADDTRSVIGYAVKTGLDYTSGTFTGEMLALVPDADLTTLQATFAAPPSGLPDVLAFPIIDLGADGRLPLLFPPLTSSAPSNRIPKLTGQLAQGHYDLIARAKPTGAPELPQALTWQRSLDLATQPTVGDWLALPTALTVQGATFSFTSVASAALTVTEIRDDQANVLWTIALLDGSSSFTLPVLTPDPLPAGTLRFRVTAVDVPNFSASSFKVDDFDRTLKRLSTDHTPFTH